MSSKDNTKHNFETLKGVKNILGVFSAKGGVGKSAISMQIAIALQKKGMKVGLADADIYGPSQSILFDSNPKELKLIPNEVMKPLKKEGIKFISMGLISNTKTPVIWRGPMVSGAVMQLLTQTDWGELDYLVVDTPPGTGDVQLTLLQKIPLSSAIVVTTPQEIAISDCKKGIEMLKKLNLPIKGLIENMSWFQPDIDSKKYYLFGKDGGKQLAKEYSIDLLAQIPLVEIDSETKIQDNDILNIEFDKITDKLLGNI
tara:strand:+ start:628 stop:1398 length:771 start_codon:yes stop_codon:yes gene_type:complete